MREQPLVLPLEHGDSSAVGRGRAVVKHVELYINVK